MDTDVIVPWRPGCPHREAAWVWTRPLWRDVGPVVEAAAPAGPWVKAHAVTPAVEASSADVVVIADADVWTDGVPAALAAVAGGAAWAIPHTMVLRLTERSTGEVYAGAPLEVVDEFTERPYRGTAGGGIVVIPRATYLDCPLDPRFVGWGQEDDALAVALTTLHGNPWRGAATLFHLWHPPQPRRSRGVGSDANLALYKRFKAARTSPGRMRALVDEAKKVVV